MNRAFRSNRDRRNLTKPAPPAPLSDAFSWWCPHRNRCGDRALTVSDLQRAAGCVRDTRGAAAAAVDHRVEAIALLLEACHDRPLQRTAARQLDAHRVDEAAVDPMRIKLPRGSLMR